jgi:hypothetical protein
VLEQMVCEATCTDIMAVGAATNATTVLQVCECMGCCQYMALAFPTAVVFLSFLACCAIAADRGRRPRGVLPPTYAEAGNAV